jgi:hypothetical protein
MEILNITNVPPESRNNSAEKPEPGDDVNK